MTTADTGALTRRLVDPEADADLLLDWVRPDRAAFWGMIDADRDDVVAIYSYIAEQPHLAAYLVHLDDVPVALFQTYDPAVDEIGEHYDRRAGDIGVHLLLADAPHRAGRTGDVVGFLLRTLFSDPDVQRIVVEPDARNTKSIALLTRIGFALGPLVERLPTPGGGEKPAQFAFLARPQVESP